MKRPFRESKQSDDIDADYMEFMRRMYEAEDEQSTRVASGMVFLISAVLTAIIIILIYKFS